MRKFLLPPAFEPGHWWLFFLPAFMLYRTIGSFWVSRLSAFRLELQHQFAVLLCSQPPYQFIILSLCLSLSLSLSLSLTHTHTHTHIHTMREWKNRNSLGFCRYDRATELINPGNPYVWTHG